MASTKEKPKTAKKAKKERKARPPVLCVHVEVLQNGARMIQVVMPLRRHGSLSLRSKGRGPFVLPAYSLPEGVLEFLRFGPGGVELVVHHKAEGFATSKGELRNISLGDRGHQTVPLAKGDYASIAFDDLRLMIKLGPPPAKIKRGLFPVPSRPDRSYRKPIFSHFFPTRHEQLATLAAAGVTAVVLGGATIGLLKRAVARPERLADVSEDYMLPFVAPEHLRTAPEALQSHLDRAHEARSVLDYYQAFSNVLMGWTGPNRDLLYPTTVDLYTRLHRAAQVELNAKIERQEAVDREQERHAGTGRLTIPAVMGETMDGSMMRIIDKIGIMEAGLEANLTAKRAIRDTFPKDPEYNWDEYKNITPKDERAAAYLSQIRPFKEETDEQAMYAEAAALGRRAERVQTREQRHRSANESLSPDAAAGAGAPIGMPDGVKYASFVGDLDFRLADEKLYQLQGSEYGLERPAGKSPVHEPLVGEIEPSLIERYIRENRFQLQLCYELALRRDGDAAGTMEWRWRIDSRGVISDVALVSSSIQDHRMAECIRQKISTWRFPRPRRGSVEVSYPFEFAPAKG